VLGEESMTKQKIKEIIEQTLTKEGCNLAVLFGSFLERDEFRDIDVLIAMEDWRPPTLDEQLYLAKLLEKRTGYLFNMVGIDSLGILIRAEILKNGLPIIVADADKWQEFCFRAWIDEMDFRLLMERFHKELNE